MKLFEVFRIFFLTLAVLALFSTYTPAFTQEINLPAIIPISGIISSPADFDGLKITVQGIVKKVKFTRSLKGKPYTLFKLGDANKHQMKVYMKGHLPIEKGTQLKVYGKFNKTKKYNFLKFKNVLKGKKFEIVS